MRYFDNKHVVVSAGGEEVPGEGDVDGGERYGGDVPDCGWDIVEKVASLCGVVVLSKEGVDM